MKKLHVAKDLALPLDTVTSTLVIYGGKGMGKTNCGAVLVEELSAAGLRFAVIDPMGVWWGVRHGIDGTGRGVEALILGGIHGDIPIEPTGGAVVADLVVDESADVIIDISRRPDGSMWSIGERIRFVTDYCKRLYQRQGERRQPLMQLIDEAARFIPQTVRKGEEHVAACMGAIAVLVEEGRNVAIGVTLITQRSARLNKDVAELADVMIAFRTVGPNSRRAVIDWLGEHVEKERLRDLDDKVRRLPVGSALVVSPGWLEFEGVVAFRARQTFDSSKTPKPGEQVRASGPGAKPDLAKYQTRMAETIERAKENDPKELKKERAALTARIAELEGQLAKAPAAKPATKVIEKPVLKDAQIVKLTAAVERLAEVESKAFDITAMIQAQRQELSAALQLVAAGAKTENATTPRVFASRPTINAPNKSADRPVAPTRRPSASSSASSGLTGPEQRILDAIAWMESIGISAPELTAVAFLAGYTIGGGGFNNPRSALRTKGLIEYRGDTVALTDAGRSVARYPNSALTADELQRRVLDRLPGPEQRLLRVLLAAYPNAVENDDLARSAGYEPGGGGFNNPRSRLRTLGLVDYPERGHVVAKPLLFLESGR